MSRLVAIYNAWTDTADLLYKSIMNIKPVVDGIIVVYSDWSYSGTFLKFPLEDLPHDGVTYVSVDPSYGELGKRNLGLNEARDAGYTHFIILDGDEFYLQDDVKRDRKFLEDNQHISGLVARVKVLFGKPTLTCDDHTIVPFIHKLVTRSGMVRCGRYPKYPFNEDENGAHIDPTRRLNITHGVEMSKTVMYHASWIRKDIDLKIANSPAVRNLMKSTIYEDLRNAAPGYYCKFYRKTLTECENTFNL